jgi:hypothetical protein
MLAASCTLMDRNASCTSNDISGPEPQWLLTLGQGSFLMPETFATTSFQAHNFWAEALLFRPMYRQQPINPLGAKELSIFLPKLVPYSLGASHVPKLAKLQLILPYCSGRDIYSSANSHHQSLRTFHKLLFKVEHNRVDTGYDLVSC